MANRIFFYVLIRSWKSFKYFDKCIDSVLVQSYQNFKILFVDDASGYTKIQKKYIKNKLFDQIVVFNSIRKYSLRNAYEVIHKYALRRNAVIFNLDGDDWLLPNALKTVAAIYTKNPKCRLTYGECLIWDGTKISNNPSRFIFPNTNTRYTAETESTLSYRTEAFRPLHPRTWRVALFKTIAKSEFLDDSDHWFRFPEDQAIFYPMLEKISGNYEVIKKPIYVYNNGNVRSIMNENAIHTLKDEIGIRKKQSTVKSYNSKIRKINIHYNRILSLPIIGRSLYLLQTILLKKRLIGNLYVSLKENILREKLLKNINKKLVIVVKSSNLSSLIKGLNNYKIFDDTFTNLHNADVEVLHNIMWTLVFCDAVGQKTRSMIVKMLPVNYPVVKI